MRSDVDSDAGATMTPPVPSTLPRGVAIWLFACAAIVYAVLIVGGITRLTHSGLSIVHWEPLAGVLPPLSDQAWATLFDQYRATPEFRLLNSDISLDGFKHIFWWEYAHRIMGRLAGLAFLLPLLWFIGSRRISPRLAWRLTSIFALGALQGALGWYMVRSGLADDPHVSPLRLMAHLAMALLIIGAMLWTAWGLWEPATAPHRVPGPAVLAVATVFAMAMTGSLVAASKAGHVFNTFPLMNGYLAPPGLMRLSPWYLNFTHNLSTIQFTHRALAWTLIALLPALWWWIRKAVPAPAARAASNWMLAALALQVALGIATLLSGVAVPWAAAHQAGAVLLFAVTLRTAYVLAGERVARPTRANAPPR